jgi:hypothetical protein
MICLAVECSPRVSLMALLVSVIVSALLINQSVSRYNNRMSLYEAGCEAERHHKFAEAERLWRTALKTDKDDICFDPLYSLTDWGELRFVSYGRPFGGPYAAIAEGHLAYVLCSRAVYFQTPVSSEAEDLYRDAMRIWCNWMVRTTRSIPKGSVVRASDLEKVETFYRMGAGELRFPLPAVGRRAARDIADGFTLCEADILWEPRSASTGSAAVEKEMQIARQKWTDAQDVLAEEHQARRLGSAK